MATSRQDPLTAFSTAGAEASTATGLLPDRPPISALFLIEFDVKAGYTIAWKQTVQGLELSGEVEYKSLPSGLHAVSEDLIYFVHEEDGSISSSGAGAGSSAGEASSTGGYAGLSAFVNLPTDEADARFARMIAVGVLVPRSYGRLGRAWRHAEALMAMAKKLAADRNEIPILEAYWSENSAPEAAAIPEGGRPLLPGGDSPLISPAVPSSFRRGTHARKRSASDGTALLLPPGHQLSPHHPAWSLTSLLDTFGPLIFPIYRAALLRKRILISTHAPVREVNNFVYNISVLANIPISVFDILEPSAAPQQRIQPLFTIGVNDITSLMADRAAAKRATHAGGHGEAGPYGGPGWIACTTDSILAMKEELWDVLVTMPSAHATQAKEKVWPTVELAKGVPLKATQRDLRRFRTLTTGLEWLANRATSDDSAAAGGSRPTSAVSTAVANSRSKNSKLFLQEDAQLVDAAESIVEPVTWSALAYNGFMWWASAGEQRRSEEAEENIYDSSLLADLVPGRSMPSPHPRVHPAAAAAARGGIGALQDSITSLTARRASTRQENLIDTEEPREEGEEADEREEEEEGEEEEEERARIELAIIAYFHRLTTQILSVLADIVESSDEDEDEDGGEGYYYDDENSSSDELVGGRGGGGGSSGGNGSGYIAAHGDDLDDHDDDLVGARRSGLASSGGAPTTALLLRRRGGGGGRAGLGRAAGAAAAAATTASSSSGTAGGRLHGGGGAAPSGSSSSSIRVNSDAVTRMGLDVWSQADAAFVQDVALLYFGRRGVQVEGKGVEVCGLKIC